MGQIITNSGLEWFADKSLDNETDIIDEMAIGTGSGSVSGSDTSMENEVFRASSSDPQLEITETSDYGIIELKMTITGGSDIPASTTITEFGVFTSGGTMIYHEFTSGTVVVNNETVEFIIELDIIR